MFRTAPAPFSASHCKRLFIDMAVHWFIFSKDELNNGLISLIFLSRCSWELIFLD